MPEGDVLDILTEVLDKHDQDHYLSFRVSTVRFIYNKFMDLVRANHEMEREIRDLKSRKRKS